MKKQIFSLCLVSLIAYGQILAGDATPGSSQATKKSPIRQYINDHVMPVLLLKRQILEKELTVAEKNEIAQCRASLSEIREQHRLFMKQKPKDMDMHTYLEQNGQGNGADMHQQTKIIMERLQAIADNHNVTLSSIKSDLEPTARQWKEDIDRLREQEESAGHWQHYPHGMEAAMLHGLTGRNAAAHFLLLGATAAENNAAADNEGELKSDLISAQNTQSASVASITGFQVGPNPASGELVTNSSEMPAQNELTIFDMQGKAVLVAQNVQAMQHLDVSTLAGGAYVVQVRSGDQTESRKIVISR